MSDEPPEGARVTDANGRVWFRNSTGWHLADMCSTGCHALAGDWVDIDLASEQLEADDA